MSTYIIEVDDSIINEQIGRILNSQVKGYLQTELNVSHGTVAEAVKEIVYSRKDEIIEKVIDRATKEIVKKGMPKLLERCYNE